MSNNESNDGMSASRLGRLSEWWGMSPVGKFDNWPRRKRVVHGIAAAALSAVMVVGAAFIGAGVYANVTANEQNIVNAVDHGDRLSGEREIGPLTFPVEVPKGE